MQDVSRAGTRGPQRGGPLSLCRVAEEGWGRGGTGRRAAGSAPCCVFRTPGRADGPQGAAAAGGDARAPITHVAQPQNPKWR